MLKKAWIDERTSVTVVLGKKIFKKTTKGFIYFACIIFGEYTIQRNLAGFFYHGKDPITKSSKCEFQWQTSK